MLHANLWRRAVDGEALRYPEKHLEAASTRGLVRARVVTRGALEDVEHAAWWVKPWVKPDDELQGLDEKAAAAPCCTWVSPQICWRSC